MSGVMIVRISQHSFEPNAPIELLQIHNSRCQASAPLLWAALVIWISFMASGPLRRAAASRASTCHGKRETTEDENSDKRACPLGKAAGKPT